MKSKVLAIFGSALLFFTLGVSASDLMQRKLDRIDAESKAVFSTRGTGSCAKYDPYDSKSLCTKYAEKLEKYRTCVNNKMNHSGQDCTGERTNACDARKKIIKENCPDFLTKEN